MKNSPDFKFCQEDKIWNLHNLPNLYLNRKCHLLNYLYTTADTGDKIF